MAGLQITSRRILKWEGNAKIPKTRQFSILEIFPLFTRKWFIFAAVQNYGSQLLKLIW